MREMNKDLDRAQKPSDLEAVRDDVAKLREEVQRLESQVAALSKAAPSEPAAASGLYEAPHPGEDPCLRCRTCAHLRLPHRSNPHYACMLQQTDVEPKWTCGAYSGKRAQ